MRVTRFDAALLYALNAVALLISYTALADFASRAGLGDLQAAAWPLVVDGLILAATRAVVTFGAHDARRYAWKLLGCAAVVSIAANATHAALPPGPVHPAIAALVAAVPPVAALAMTHLVVVRARVRQDAAAVGALDASPQVEVASPRDEPAQVEATDRSGAVPVAFDDAPQTLSPTQLHAVDASADATEPSVDAPPEVDLRQQVLDLYAQGGLSGRAIAKIVGVSEATARRYRDAAQTQATA